MEREKTFRRIEVSIRRMKKIFQKEFFREKIEKLILGFLEEVPKDVKALKNYEYLSNILVKKIIDTIVDNLSIEYLKDDFDLYIENLIYKKATEELQKKCQHKFEDDADNLQIVCIKCGLTHPVKLRSYPEQEFNAQKYLKVD